MQISDEQVDAAENARSVRLLNCPAHLLTDEIYTEAMRLALEAALSLPVQPVAAAEPAGFFVLAEPNFKLYFCLTHADAEHAADNYRKYVKGCTGTRIEPLYRTPPVPPTKGLEDDLIAALERVKALVVGDRAPNWNSDMAVTQSRMSIADICDLALRSALTPSVQP